MILPWDLSNRVAGTLFETLSFLLVRRPCDCTKRASCIGASTGLR